MGTELAPVFLQRGAERALSKACSESRSKQLFAQQPRCEGCECEPRWAIPCLPSCSGPIPQDMGFPGLARVSRAAQGPAVTPLARTGRTLGKMLLEKPGLRVGKGMY